MGSKSNTVELTPRKAIFKFCRECTSNSISLCASPKCALFAYKRQKTEPVRRFKSGIRAIRGQCLDCTGNNREETKNCTDLKCFLYPFRLGKNPYKKPLSEKERKRRVEMGFKSV